MRQRSTRAPPDPCWSPTCPRSASVTAGPESAIERAFRGITQGGGHSGRLRRRGEHPRARPRGTGHRLWWPAQRGRRGPARFVPDARAAQVGGRGVAGLEGVKTPSLVAKAVAELTDHHLIVGRGAQDFARALGFEIHDDLNTEASRALWLEWRRRVDPGHWLDPGGTATRGGGVPPDCGISTMPPSLPASPWSTTASSTRTRSGARPAWRPCRPTATSAA